jgi:hypothetical protein
MKITPTNLLSTGAHVLIYWFVGVFMLVNAAVIGIYVSEGFHNYGKYQDANITHTVQYHKFLSHEFTTNPRGVLRYCTALTDGPKVAIRELPNAQGVIPAGDFCKQMMGTAPNWKSKIPTKKMTLGNYAENLFGAVMFFLIFMSGAYLVATIPANALGLMFSFLLPYTRVLAMVFTIPVLFFWILFVKDAWNPNPTYWHYEERVVETHKVFMNDKGQMFIAPYTLFGWTDPDTMTEITLKD